MSIRTNGLTVYQRSCYKANTYWTQRREQRGQNRASLSAGGWIGEPKNSHSLTLRENTLPKAYP